MVQALEPTYPDNFPSTFEHNDMCLGTQDGKPWFNANCDLVMQQKNIRLNMLNARDFNIEIDGKCLDSNGEEVYIIDCNGGDYQKWSLELKQPSEQGVSNILHTQSKKCLDANAEGRVYMGPCSVDNGYQKFKYGRIGGRFAIASGESLTGEDNYIISAKIKFAAVMQNDGNFVIYRLSKQIPSSVDMIPENAIFSTGTNHFVEGYADGPKKVTAENIMKAGKATYGNVDPTEFQLKLEKNGELKIVSPQNKTVLILFQGGTDSSYELRFGLGDYAHRLELHNKQEKSIVWTSENMQVNPKFVQGGAQGTTSVVAPAKSDRSTKYGSPTMFYVNHNGKMFFARKAFFATCTFEGGSKKIQVAPLNQTSLIETCFTDMVTSIDWNKDFYVINYRYIYMVDSGKVTRIDPGYFNNIISISVNKAGNNLAIIADVVGNHQRQHKNTLYLWFLESWDEYPSGWYYIRKDGYAMYPVKDNNNNNEMEFNFRVTKVDLDEDGFNKDDLFRKIVFCGESPSLYTTNRGIKKRFKIMLDGNEQRYGHRTSMFVGGGTILKELCRNEWKDEKENKTYTLNCLFTTSRNHYTIVVCTGYDIMIYYSKFVSQSFGDFVKELAIYFGIELITMGLCRFATVALQIMKTSLTWGKIVTFAATTIGRINNSGVMTTIRTIGQTTSQYVKPLVVPFKVVGDVAAKAFTKTIGTFDDIVKLGVEAGEEILEAGVGYGVETAWDKVYDKATQGSNSLGDVEDVKYAVANKFKETFYYMYVSSSGDVFSIVDATDQGQSEAIHRGVFDGLSKPKDMPFLIRPEEVAIREQKADQTEAEARKKSDMQKELVGMFTKPGNQQNFTEQEIEGFSKSNFGSFESYEDDPNDYNVDKEEGDMDYKDINVYELYATTFPTGDEDIDKRMRKNNIKMNEVKNLVSSKDSEQNFIFLQADHEIYLCYRTDDRLYNMIQIYQTSSPILSIGCDIDGQRVFILKANGVVFTGKNSSSTKRDGNGAIVADAQPSFSFEPI